jgi:hypothetical protein
MTVSLWRRWVGAARPRVPGKSFPPHREALGDHLTLGSFHVTNCNDSGPGSLRLALLDANAAGGNDRNITDFTPTHPLYRPNPLLQQEDQRCCIPPSPRT